MIPSLFRSNFLNKFSAWSSFWLLSPAVVVPLRLLLVKILFCSCEFRMLTCGFASEPLIWVVVLVSEELLAVAWFALVLRANFPIRSWTELTILLSSSLVIIPSPFISYRVKIHLSCSSMVPRVRTESPMTKSVKVISCFRCMSKELKTNLA